jgi:hypothetical protein
VIPAKRRNPQSEPFVGRARSKSGRRDFKLTSFEKVANLVSPATKKARELLCRDVQGYTCQSYPTITTTRTGILKNYLIYNRKKPSVPENKLQFSIKSGI